MATGRPVGTAAERLEMAAHHRVAVLHQKTERLARRSVVLVVAHSLVGISTTSPSWELPPRKIRGCYSSEGITWRSTSRSMAIAVF